MVGQIYLALTSQINLADPFSVIIYLIINKTHLLWK